MPDITRELKFKPRNDGSVRVKEVLTSAQGHVIRHSYTAQSEAQAIIDMNAREVTEQFEDADFRELLAWVRAKKAPDAFDFADRELTLLVGEERLLVHFATNPGSDVISLAWWIEAMNPPTYNAIRVRSGYDSGTGSDIHDRALAMNAVEPVFDVVEDVPDD